MFVKYSIGFIDMANYFGQTKSEEGLDFGRFAKTLPVTLIVTTRFHVKWRKSSDRSVW
jgi:hypothetical protein